MSIDILMNFLLLFSSAQICDNRTASIGPSQDYRLSATLICWSHQSISLSDPARTQVFALRPNPPPRHQARQLAGEQQLRAEDLRLRLGARWRAGPVEAHDTGGRHAILSCAWDSHGRATLFSCGGRLVGRLHLWRTSRSENSFPGSESSSTG